MEAAGLLFRLLALLVAARLAAEIAERLRLPAVLVEISAGLLLGPSLLGLVGHEPSLRFLGELGAIFLLMEVGLHMDIGDLRRVGRAAMFVAVAGIVVPMVGGVVAMRGIGLALPVAVFLGAAITATSVGITARVFAEMRALASTEAQTVLGAAVADDVIGLMILTVVARLAETGSIEAGPVIVIALTGIAFVVIAAGLGSWIAPLVFDRLVARARTEGTLIGAAIAFTLAFAGLAGVVRLAPIVGAFVAGLALGRIEEKEELQRRLAPVAHIFVPVFFLLIGAEARVAALAEPGALRIIVVLGAIALIGKVVSGFVIRRGAADRLVIGIGMIPRGEVGVVFATLGLSSGVLRSREHAALLTVVLATTMVAPPLLRKRIERTRRRALQQAVDTAPPDGWLTVADGVCELRAEPPFGLAAKIGLEAALLCASERPGPHLLGWLSRASAEPPKWDDELRSSFLELLRTGNPRSWRLLDVTGLLASLVPDVGAELRRRKQDVFELDPAGPLRWDEVEAVMDLAGRDGDPAARLWPSVDQDAVLVAALGRSAFRGAETGTAARRLAITLGFDDARSDLVAFLADGCDLLLAAASRLTSFASEEYVLEVAAHVRTSPRADALYVLAAATTRGLVHREALAELHGLVVAALAHPELTGAEASDLVETRRRLAIERLPRIPDPTVRRLLEAAPRRYVLVHPPETIARHVRMLEQPLARGEVRIHAEPDLERGEWTIDVVATDRPGALAAIARAFALCDVPIVEAWISTWSNGAVVDVFRTSAPSDIDWAMVRDAAATALDGSSLNGGPAPIEASVDVDNAASPWHTIVELRASDRTGLLHRVAGALSRAGIDVHHASVRTIDGTAVDTFLVTGRGGGKLDPNGERALRLALNGGTTGRWTPARLREATAKLRR